MYGQNGPNFSAEISFYTSLAIWHRMLFFLNDVDIQLILGFKYILENYYP